MGIGRHCIFVLLRAVRRRAEKGSRRPCEVLFHLDVEAEKCRAVMNRSRQKTHVLEIRLVRFKLCEARFEIAENLRTSMTRRAGELLFPGLFLLRVRTK